VGGCSDVVGSSPPISCRAHDDLLPPRMWLLRKDGHEAAMDLGAVPGVGAEIVLSVDGDLRRATLPRARAGGTARRDCGQARYTGLPVVPASGTIPTPKLRLRLSCSGSISSAYLLDCTRLSSA
jgi:hypothetical protein